MKTEDPFCAEWHWNLYWWLVCDILVEIWSKSNYFRYYFRDGDTEIIVLLLRDISTKRGLMCIWRGVWR